MSDLRPGIYKIGLLSIIALRDDLIGVGWNGKYPMQQVDMARAKQELGIYFPNAKVFIVDGGPVSYETLAASVDFRGAVEVIVAEQIKRALNVR